MKLKLTFILSCVILFFGCADLTLSTFDSRELSSLCTDGRINHMASGEKTIQPTVLPTLSKSLLKSKKVSDFTTAISYVCDILVVGFANQSVCLFRITDAGESV